MKEPLKVISIIYQRTIWGSLKNPSEGAMKNALGVFKEPLRVPQKKLEGSLNPFWETKGSIENALKTFYGELHNFILDIFGDRKGLL